MELKLSWDAAIGAKIANCWCHTGILLHHDSDQDGCLEGDILLSRLRGCLKEAGTADPESRAKQLPDADEEAEVEEQLCNEAILDATMDVRCDADSASSEESVESSNNAKSCCYTSHGPRDASDCIAVF